MQLNYSEKILLYVNFENHQAGPRQHVTQLHYPPTGARSFWVLHPVPLEVWGFPDWQVETGTVPSPMWVPGTLPGPVWVLGTDPSNPPRQFFYWPQAVILTCLHEAALSRHPQLSPLVLCPGNTDTLVSADSQLHLLDLKTLPSSAQAPPSGIMAWELTYIIPLTLFVFSAVYCLMSNVLKNSFKYLSGFLVVSGRRVNQLHSILDNGANHFYTHRISWLQGHNHFLSIFLTWNMKLLT